MTLFRSTSLALSALVVSTLTACGGGGDSGPHNTAFSLSVDPATITPTATSTDTSFQNTGAAEFMAYGSSSCYSTAKGQPVLETANTVTYNNGTASAAHMKRIAQYAEASIQMLRSQFGITAPNNVGFDGQKVRVCAAIGGSSNQTNGTAGIRTLMVEAPEGDAGLDRLVYHELVHMVQAQALNCQTQQYGWERWYTEGMAVHMAGQDMPGSGDIASLKTVFAGFSGGVPFADTDQRAMWSADRYPGYRLAVETLLGETGKSDVDLYKFLKSVGSTSGCPAYSTTDPTVGWKAAFDAYFGADLRGSGALGAGFWAAAAKYLH